MSDMIQKDKTQDYINAEKLVDQYIKEIEVVSKPDNILDPFSIVLNKSRLELLYKSGAVLLDDYKFNNVEDLENSIHQILKVFYIREHLTKYQSDLFEGKGSIRYNDLISNYRKSVFDKIAQVYPNLKDECQHQYEILEKISDVDEKSVYSAFWKLIYES